MSVFNTVFHFRLFFHGQRVYRSIHLIRYVDEGISVPGIPSVHYSSLVPGHKLIHAQMCLATEQQKMFSFSLSNVAKYFFTFKNMEIAYKNEMDYE